MTETKYSSSEGPQASDPQTTVHFDSTNVKSSYANACTVSSTREEIVLNFGLNQVWERPQQEAQVQLTNRIILNPYTAKRLALLLGAVVQQYEKQFGAFEVGTSQAQANPPTENRPHAVK